MDTFHQCQKEVEPDVLMTRQQFSQSCTYHVQHYKTMEDNDSNFNEFAGYYTIAALNAKHQTEQQSRHSLIANVVNNRKRLKRKQRQNAAKDVELELSTSEKVEDLVERLLTQKIGPQIKQISSAIEAIQKGTNNARSKKKGEKKRREKPKNSSSSGKGVATGSKKSYAESVRSPRRDSDAGGPSAKRSKQSRDRSKSRTNATRGNWTSRNRGSR